MRHWLAGALATALLAAFGCGGGGVADGGERRLTVSAATSLTNAFEEYGADFAPATTRFSFAGSDDLAAQIRQGVKPDVYAAANTKLPEQLYDEGLVGKPVKFAGNRLVIAVPAVPADINSLRDLGKGPQNLVIGAESVPVGEYTQDLLSRLPPSRSKAIRARVRSEEPDVAGVVGKLTQGAADAGILYITDVAAAGKKMRAIELPPVLQPNVEYSAAVVKGAKEPVVAREFIDGLLSGKGADALRRAGFEPPPSR
ncbi:MAG: molybdate ABC transporter substrate-binding protein [Thermoleophilaceae bacterium]|nr:molybdate ABC transporter substrate-binding protein [Thermoleophilaceae bacterium]